MKTNLNFLFILIIAASIFTGCSGNTRNFTIEKGVLLVGINIDYPPMEYIADDGITPIGFDVSLGKAIADKMGLDIQFIDTSWDRIFSSVNEKRYDCIISSVTITEDRLQRHNFSKPYIINTPAIVMRIDSRLNVRSPYDLRGLKVSFQDGTTASDYLIELEGEGLQFTKFAYDRIMYCFDDLRLGRVDAVLTDILVAYHYLSYYESFDVVWQGEAEVFGICMRKGDDILTNAINKALDSLFEDGTMLRLSRDYFSGMDLVTAVRQLD